MGPGEESQDLWRQNLILLQLLSLASLVCKIPYSRDQTPRLLMFSARAEGRLLFKSGHCSRAAFVKFSMLMSASRGAKRAAVACSIAGLAAATIPFSLRQWISPSSVDLPSVIIPEIILISARWVQSTRGYYSRAATISFRAVNSAATIRERLLNESGV